MWDNYLFYILLLSQVALISLYLPERLIGQVRQVIKQHPQSEFPRLYPVSMATLESDIRRYRYMNLTVVSLGLLIISFSAMKGYQDLLNWDNNAVQTIYFFLQYLPVIVVGRRGCHYQQLIKQQNTSATRKAGLNRRRLFDFIAPGLLLVALICYLIYVLIVLYFVQHPFDGFAGYINIVVVTVINLLFALQIYRYMYGKRKNPLEADEDRNRNISIFIKLLVIGSIGISVYLSMSLVMAALDLRHIQNIVFSAYCQLISLLTFYNINFSSLNFEVYRQTPATEL